MHQKPNFNSIWKANTYFFSYIPKLWQLPYASYTEVRLYLLSDSIITSYHILLICIILRYNSPQYLNITLYHTSTNLYFWFLFDFFCLFLQRKMLELYNHSLRCSNKSKIQIFLQGGWNVQLFVHSNSSCGSCSNDMAHPVKWMN